MDKRFKNSFRATGMRSVLVVSFVGVVIFSMLFVGLSLKEQFVKELFKSASSNNNEIMEQVEINLDNYFYSMVSLSDFLAVKISGNSNFETEELDSLIQSTISSRRDVISVSLVDEKGKHVESTDDYTLQETESILSQEWFTKIKNDKYYINISKPHVQNLFVGEYPWVISISRRVGYREEGEYREGILLIDMNFTVIEELLNSVNLGKKGYVFLVDENADIIYHNQQQLLFSGMKSENVEGVLEAYNESFLQGDRLITVRILTNVSWKLVGVYNVSDLDRSQKEISDYVKLIFLFGILIFVSASVFMSSRISKPILELEKSMKSVENGNFDVELAVKGEYEVMQLTQSFNGMIKRIRSLMDQIVIEQELKRKSELSALQAQINPHFLYNTLDSIIWMAENNKNEEVVLMTNSLASLFRISISRGDMIISVKDELDHAHYYLTIQKMRYKNKFEFKFEIDEGVYKYNTLKLILQPIIENAIYHGIRYMVDEGEIIIRAYIREDNLIFEVEDDGLGMDVDQFDFVQVGKTSSPKSGVGIRNVHERIGLLFGKAYGLQIVSEIEAGTKVLFILPKNEEAI